MSSKKTSKKKCQVLFSRSYLQGNADGNHNPRAHIYVWQVSFVILGCQIVGDHFFAKIRWMPRTTIRANIYVRDEVSFAELVCQTLGD
jgi:hypothetical protein